MRQFWFLAIVVALIIRDSHAYKWGTDRCGPPDHGSGSRAASSGIKLVMDAVTSSIILTDTSSFRGFYMSTTNGLVWSNPSAGAQVSGLCGNGNTAMFHRSSVAKTMIKGTVDCSKHASASFSVTAYVVYAKRSPYEYLTVSFVCPAASSAVTTSSPGSGGSGVATASAGGSFTSLGVISFDWVPYLLSVRAAGSSSERSDIQVYFDLKGNSKGWIGLGFGYNDYSMTGGKKAVVLRAGGGACSVEFYSLVAHNIQAVSGGASANDPWSVVPSCSFVTPYLVSLVFSVGGTSAIALPAQGTSMYILTAGGLGTNIIDNHGSMWDYKYVDLLSGDSPSGGTGEVNPYYLWHGIIFIVNFAVLMPLTSFLILINRNRFYTVHKWLGVVIVALLIAGWVLIGPGSEADEEGAFDPFSSDSVGRDHASFGSIGCWVAVGVCAMGVVLWFIRLPATMRKGVRYAHGFAGIALSFLGPYVVWTGWVRLAPAVTTALLNTPWVWLSMAVTLGAIYVTYYAFTFFRQDKARKQAGAEMERVITPAEMQSMISGGELVLVIDGAVCRIPKKFDHPGGRAVMEQFNGQEVGAIMKGLEAAQVKGRSKFFPHSSDAFKSVREMKIGVLMGTYLEHLGASAPLDSGPESTPQEATIVSMDVINKAQDFPVRLFRFGVAAMDHLVGIDVGSRVYVSLPNVAERPYTVCGIDRAAGVVEFAIKIYPAGVLTSRLNKLRTGSSVVLSRPVSHPPVPSVPTPPSLVVFIAGGTGMTPMISYFDQLANVPLGGVLLWWVRHEHDLFLMDELKRWTESKNLRVIIFFTGGDAASRVVTLPVLSGRITAGTILEAFGGDLPVNAREIAWIMSGPGGFIGATETALDQVGARKARILSLD